MSHVCPRCGKGIRIAELDSSFSCKSCGAVLSFSYLRWMVITFTLGGVVWLGLEALLFRFRSDVTSLFVLGVSLLLASVIGYYWTSVETKGPGSH